MRTSRSRIALSDKHAFASEPHKDVLERRLCSSGDLCPDDVVGYVAPAAASALDVDLAYLPIQPKTEMAHSRPILPSPPLPNSLVESSLESRLSDEAHAYMCGRLIEAQERERAWIARELHDDVVQRIALLALSLNQCEQDIPRSTLELHEHIRQVRRGLSEITEAIRGLSHRLHSWKLDYLGIAVAAGGFCKELSEQRNVEVNFSLAAGIPCEVPKEISLCLFRVLQEALQNAVKHSGEHRFRVDLRGGSKGIELSVCDSGVGFDPDVAASSGGLGLISMQERMHLIGGEFMILSQPNRGTTVYAYAPLGAEEHGARRRQARAEMHPDEARLKSLI